MRSAGIITITPPGQHMCLKRMHSVHVATTTVHSIDTLEEKMKVNDVTFQKGGN